MNSVKMWADAFNDAFREIRAGRRDPSSPILLNALQVSEILHVDLEWVAARRHLLPCFEVPSDDGADSLARLRVRIEDLGAWKHATRELR